MLRHGNTISKEALAQMDKGGLISMETLVQEGIFGQPVGRYRYPRHRFSEADLVTLMLMNAKGRYQIQVRIGTPENLELGDNIENLSSRIPRIISMWVSKWRNYYLGCYDTRSTRRWVSQRSNSFLCTNR
jgi:hypothetical protein